MSSTHIFFSLTLHVSLVRFPHPLDGPEIPNIYIHIYREYHTIPQILYFEYAFIALFKNILFYKK